MNTICTVLLFASVAIGTSSAQIKMYTTRTAWLAATSRVTTIDFTAEARPPAGSYTLYPPPGLTLSGVNFSNTKPGGSVTVVSQTYCCPTYARGSDQLASDTGIQVTLPAGTTAVGFDLFTVIPGVADGSNQDPVDVTVAGQKYVTTTAAAPNTVFVGFVSASPISNLTIIPEQVHGAAQADVINFSFSAAAAGSNPTTTALGSSANPAVFGQSVTLTATVSPAAATGKVTFYDGVSVLGAATLSGGRAAMTTQFLPSGVRALKAYYTGDSAYGTSASPPFSQTVTALGENGFQPAVSYGGFTLVMSLAIGDFNGDGRADLAVLDFTLSKVGIMLGSGNGTFAAPVFYATNPTNTVLSNSIVVGDFNRDGRADLAIVNAGNPSNVAVLLGNGDGTFQTPVTYLIGHAPNSIVAGDFNGDGITDVAITNFSDNSVSILLGNGDGTFQTAVSYPAGANPVSIAAEDFNRDGQTDLVVANGNGNTVSVLLGKGNGTFQAPVSYATGAGPGSVAVGDFNGDGRPDIAVRTTGAVGILIGRGDGTFNPVVNYPAGDGLQSIVAADVNGDGRLDLLTTNGDNGGNILLGNGDGSFQAPVKYAAGPQEVKVAVGDFNGDGRADLAVANFSPGGASVLLGIPSGPPPPHIAAGGVVGAGLSTPLVKVLSPNTIATVFGDTFAPSGTARPVVSTDFVNGRLPTALNGVCVYVNNIASPLYFLGANQINFQAPQIPTSGSVGVQVAISCGTPNEVRSLTENVAAAATTAEFFYFKLNQDGKNPIAALNASTGAYIGPPNLVPGGTFVSASQGDILTLFFTGGGTTNPAFAPGELPAGGANITSSTAVSIGGTQLASGDILYSGVAPGFAGLYQLNIRIPLSVQSGNQPVVLTIGDSMSPAGYLLIGSGN